MGLNREYSTYSPVLGFWIYKKLKKIYNQIKENLQQCGELFAVRE